MVNMATTKKVIGLIFILSFFEISEMNSNIDQSARDSFGSSAVTSMKNWLKSDILAIIKILHAKCNSLAKAH